MQQNMHNGSMHIGVCPAIREDNREKRSMSICKQMHDPIYIYTNAFLGNQIEDALLVLLHQLLTSMEEMQVIQT